MRDHTAIEEPLALEALGGLEPDDRTRLDALLADHGPDCPECAELRAEFADVAAMLGAGLAPSPISDALEDRTVAAALATQPLSGRVTGERGPAAIAPTHRGRNAL